MPLFSYQAKTLAGQLIRGEMEAGSDSELRIKLRSNRLIPLKVNIKQKRNLMEVFNSSIGSIPDKELQVFTRQFATLVNSGIPIVQSIDILGGSTRNPTLKKAISRIKEDVEGGKKLADAMAVHKNIFDTLYINLVKAGEESGSLDKILERLASYIEKSGKIKGKIKGALFYPAGILVVAAIVVSAILTFVIPKFEEMFKSSGQELPWLTQQVVAASHFLTGYWYLAVAFVVILFSSFNSYRKTPKGIILIDSILIQTPLFGPLIQKGAIARFSRTLGTMIQCGVPIIEGLHIAAKVVGNATIERTFMLAKEVIAQGQSIVGPLSKDPYIPDMVVQMIGVGEQTGALDVMLNKIADFYEEEVDYAVTALTSMIEPIMMVFLGGTIAVLVIAMYLPIFKMASTMGA